MFWAGPIEAMRQKEGKAGLTPPLVLSTAQELVDDDL